MLELIIKWIELIIPIPSRGLLLLFNDHLVLQAFVLLQNVLPLQVVSIDHIGVLLYDSEQSVELLISLIVLSFDPLVLPYLLQVVFVFQLKLF